MVDPQTEIQAQQEARRQAERTVDGLAADELAGFLATLNRILERLRTTTTTTTDRPR